MAKQTSWRPLIVRSTISPVLTFRVFCGLAMLEVGLKATLNTIGAPFVIPPFTPPAPFVSTTGLVPQGASERSDSGSLRGTPLSPPPGAQGGGTDGQRQLSEGSTTRPGQKRRSPRQVLSCQGLPNNGGDLLSQLVGQYHRRG